MTTWPEHGRRARMRRHPVGRWVLRIVVFVAGAVPVLVGLAAAALPGPLTIPPVLLGLWIWSREFAWADRLFRQCSVRARHAWEQARARPTAALLTTAAGLALVTVAVWATARFPLLDMTRAAVGL